MLRKFRAQDSNDAAQRVARAIARRVYGRRGIVRTLRCDAWCATGSVRHFEAFLGVLNGPHETTGANFRFTVRSA